MEGVTPIHVAFTAWNRPDHLRETLRWWSRVRGVEDAFLEFHIEPGCEEVIELCEAVDFAPRHLSINKERCGHAANTLKSMNRAFLATDYAITAVDDFLPSADLLELHAWHRANYAEDDSVLCMSSGRDLPAPDPDLAAVWRCQLIGILSGFHRHKWHRLAEQWDMATNQGWWAWVNHAWLQTGRYDVLFPALSRAEDIGDLHPSTCFAPNPPPQAYYEVKGRRERAMGFARYYEEY